jgi:hypothetical protein
MSRVGYRRDLNDLLMAFHFSFCGNLETVPNNIRPNPFILATQLCACDSAKFSGPLDTRIGWIRPLFRICSDASIPSTNTLFIFWYQRVIKTFVKDHASFNAITKPPETHNPDIP